MFRFCCIGHSIPICVSLNLFAIRFIYLTMYYEYLLFECISFSLELWSIINSMVIPAFGYGLISVQKTPTR